MVFLVPKSFSITLDGTSFLCIGRGNLPISKTSIMISLTESERYAVKFLETFVPISCKDLIDNEFDVNGLQNLLHKYFLPMFQ